MKVSMDETDDMRYETIRYDMDGHAGLQVPNQHSTGLDYRLART